MPPYSEFFYFRTAAHDGPCVCPTDCSHAGRLSPSGLWPHARHVQVTSTAGGGTLTLEFGILSRLTGDPGAHLCVQLAFPLFGGLDLLTGLRGSV